MMNVASNFLKALSNREIAIAIWILIAIIGYVFHPKIKKLFFDVIKTFFAWKLAISYVMMFAYIAVIIWMLNVIGIWKIAHLPLTILWCVCVAFFMLFDFSKVNDPNFFKNSIKDNLKCLIFIEFLINLYVFDLWFEIILVPVFVFFGGMIAIAETDEKYEMVKKVLTFIMSLIGLVFIGYASYMVITDFKHFATLENFENFYLPILFSITFLPFVYLAALYAGYETFFVRLKFFVPDGAVLNYAKIKTIYSFNFNLWKLDKWSKYISSSWRFKTRNEVDEAIMSFKNAPS